MNEEDNAPKDNVTVTILQKDVWIKQRRWGM